MLLGRLLSSLELLIKIVNYILRCTLSARAGNLEMADIDPCRGSTRIVAQFENDSDLVVFGKDLLTHCP